MICKNTAITNLSGVQLGGLGTRVSKAHPSGRQGWHVVLASDEKFKWSMVLANSLEVRPPSRSPTLLLPAIPPEASSHGACQIKRAHLCRAAAPEIRIITGLQM